MEVDRSVLVLVDLVGRPRGGLAAHAQIDEHRHQLGPLRLGMPLEGRALHPHFGVDLFVGSRHGRVLAKRHREGPGK